jgi:hypothetical protein
MGTHGADGANGATGYQRGSKDLLEVVGFVLGKGEREGKGGDETRLATEAPQRQGAGRLFVPCSSRDAEDNKSI